MCIYCGTTQHRKIYESHFGPIPKDDTGRTCEIHHINNGHSNNDLINLKCVSIQEHYDIHYAQGDYGACQAIAIRMKISHEEKSKLASLAAIKRVIEGTLNLLGDKNPVHDLIANGTFHMLKKNGGSERMSKIQQELISKGIHHFSRENGGSELARKYALERVVNGTNIFAGENNPVFEAIANGTFYMLKENGGSEKAKERMKKQIENGKNIFATDSHPNKVQIKCPHCDKIGGAVNMRRWHFDNCVRKLIT
jgi:hypothetical protein